MAAMLPIVIGPTLASAAAPVDPALDTYRQVMAEKDGVETGDSWAAVERWCESERDALQALTDQMPPGVEALLRRVALLGDRLEDAAHWGLQDEEAELIWALSDRAKALLEHQA
ncbi:hypothetical protein [Teichococcus vastitatis]|uniref:hypothetical protein n=1 Tax=Teichococcus vastitatis TaxID=2307076 RepID=UPI000E73317B|nr:hypothetical protein [Pseudoroseomonas vastitatis]